MTDLSFLLTPALAFLIAAGSPGPATLTVAATAMARGRRAGIAAGMGLGVGLTVWGIVAAAGLGAAIVAWAPALFALRLAGGTFLLWLAWKSARAALAPSATGHLPSVPARALFRRGLLLNLLNPKAVLAWGAVIAIGLPPGAGLTELWLITATCTAIGFALYALYAMLFAMPPVMAAYARFRRWLEGAFAIGFGLAGLRLLTWRPAAA